MMISAMRTIGAIIGMATATALGANLNELLEPIRKQHELPALAGLILKGDRILESGAVGVRANGSTENVTADDLFHIGSCTKAMTATMLAMLVEQGKLSWTTTPADVFPDLAPRMHADYRGVTLEQLLTHRGGAPENLDEGGLWGRLWKRDGTPMDQRRMLVEGVLTRAPQSPPGKKYLYSNAGYAIAGAMAERVTGKSYEALMREMLFEPLDMKSAGFGAPGSTNTVDQPRGHVREGKRLKAVEPGDNADNPPAIAPAGTVHCSLSDWAKFVSLHLKGLRGESTLLKPESFRKLHTPPSGGDYAFGWSVTQREWGGSGNVFTHAGSNTMWYAVVWASPEKNFAVLGATNCGGDSAAKACDEAAWAMIQRLLKGL